MNFKGSRCKWMRTLSHNISHIKYFYAIESSFSVGLAHLKPRERPNLDGEPSTELPFSPVLVSVTLDPRFRIKNMVLVYSFTKIMYISVQVQPLVATNNLKTPLGTLKTHYILLWKENNYSSVDR